MARRGGGLMGATTHASRHNGHGRKEPRYRFAVPVLKRPKGKTAPWFLKQFGSRPAHKLRRPLADVA